MKWRVEKGEVLGWTPSLNALKTHRGKATKGNHQIRLVVKIANLMKLLMQMQKNFSNSKHDVKARVNVFIIPPEIKRVIIPNWGLKTIK